MNEPSPFPAVSPPFRPPTPQLYYYPGFMAARDGTKLTAEITHNLTRPTAWEAVMRVRCSKGLRISAFHGHFFNRWGGRRLDWGDTYTYVGDGYESV